MSSHFSANQYESAFDSKALANWEVPATYKLRPVTLRGHTQIISDDCGALQEEVPRSTSNPWGNFVGTWEMPKKIAGNQARVPTGRTSYAQQKLMEESKAAELVLTGGTKNQIRSGRLMEPDGPPPKSASKNARLRQACTPPGGITGNYDVAVELNKTPTQLSPLPPGGDYQNFSPAPNGEFKTLSPAPDGDYTHVTPPPSGDEYTKPFTPPVVGTPNKHMYSSPSPGGHGIRFASPSRMSPMGVGRVVTPEVARSPVTPTSPPHFCPEEMVMSPGHMGLISPASPDLGAGLADPQH